MRKRATPLPIPSTLRPRVHGYPLSCTLGRSVLGKDSGIARFLMTAEYATYRYLRCAVNVKSIITKLDHYGIRESTLTLLISFLKRQQFVSLQNVNSQIWFNDYGVPQGSILGALLFLLYINDLLDTVLSSPILC